MESTMCRCPKCKQMTAERNHYTGEVICYNRFCFRDSLINPQEEENDSIKATEEFVRSKKLVINTKEPK